MILFLRTEKNKNVFEVDIYTGMYEGSSPKQNYLELGTTLYIREYSNLLLANQNKAEEIIRNFEALMDLRSWLWEGYFGSKKNTEEDFPKVLKLLRTMLEKVAQEYNLTVVED